MIAYRSKPQGERKKTKNKICNANGRARCQARASSGSVEQEKGIADERCKGVDAETQTRMQTQANTISNSRGNSFITEGHPKA